MDLKFIFYSQHNSIWTEPYQKLETDLYKQVIAILWNANTNVQMKNQLNAWNEMKMSPQ